MATKKRSVLRKKLSELQLLQFKEVCREIRDAITAFTPTDFSKPLVPSSEQVLYELLSRILKLVHLRKRNEDVGGLVMNYQDRPCLDNVFIQILTDVTTLLGMIQKPPYDPQATLKACVTAWDSDTSELYVVLRIVRAWVASKQSNTSSEVLLGIAGQQISPEQTVVLTEGKQHPAAYLHGWKAILDALDLPFNPENKRRVERTAQKFDGPLGRPRKRGQAPNFVPKDELIDWWNSMADRHERLSEIRALQERDARATLSNQLPSGHNGNALPDIAGQVVTKLRQISKPRRMRDSRQK